MIQPSQNSKIISNFKTADTILAILFLTSIGLVIWAINIYRLTIIDAKYLFAISALGTIIVFAIILLQPKRNYSVFWTFIISSAIGGGLFYFGLLYLNQAFADNEFVMEEFQIVKTGNLGRGGKSRCFQPYAVVDFHGKEKQLVFYCDFEKTIKSYSKVALTYSKGGLGFDIIKTKQLTQ